MKNVAIIPARGGSKRILKKNIKKFLGKPMLSYPVKVAFESGLFDKVIVSTDSDEIATEAENCGAQVPFIRPDELADDFVGTTPVTKHAVQYLLDTGYELDYACCIYATTPLLEAGFLRSGLERLVNSDLDYVFSVTTFPYPVQRSLRTDDKGMVSPAYPDYLNSRSQDLEELYHDAAQFYWGSKEAWLTKSHMFTARSMGEVLPRHLVQDIDTKEDWVRAEYMYKLINR